MKCSPVHSGSRLAAAGLALSLTGGLLVGLGGGTAQAGSSTLLSHGGLNTPQLTSAKTLSLTLCTGQPSTDPAPFPGMVAGLGAQFDNPLVPFGGDALLATLPTSGIGQTEYDNGGFEAQGGAFLRPLPTLVDNSANDPGLEYPVPTMPPTPQVAFHPSLPPNIAPAQLPETIEDEVYGPPYPDAGRTDTLGRRADPAPAVGP